jgi:deoxyribodipyrimidine photo-lyase
MFTADYHSILKLIDQIKPEDYVRNRNFIDGDVTLLSPYISRGVISTKIVLDYLKAKHYDLNKIEKFIQELAWRDYWQQVWVAKGIEINQAIRQDQVAVQNHQIADAIIKAETNITAIDTAISTFYETGYLHNHVRMYIATIAGNIAQSHWLVPAKWMYYHLLDGDWASNALSWQWVVGANSNKKYYANQENINKYCLSEQTGTFLDIPYEGFEKLAIPPVLEATVLPKLTTSLPITESLQVDSSLATFIYTSYNLDPEWGKDKKANRILLLEPSHFEEYPVSEKVIQFILDLSENISDCQVYCGEFSDLVAACALEEIHYKEHPLSTHFTGIKHERDWMFTVKGYHQSFFAFWKKCKRELND